MGAQVSSITKEVKSQQADAEQRVTAELTQLETILRNKLESFKMKVKQDQPGDKTIPIDTVLTSREFMSYNVSDKPSEELSNALTDMFGGSFLNSLKGIASVALNSLLGNASAGASERVDYRVMFVYGAVIRVDYMMYTYNMSSTGVSGRVKNGFCFYASLSTVKLATTGEEVIAYVLGEAADQGLRYLQSRVEWAKRLLMTCEKPTRTPEDVATLSAEIINAYGKSLTEDEITRLKPTPAPEGKEEDNDKNKRIREDAERIVPLVTSKLNGELNAINGDPRRLITNEQNDAIDAISKLYRKIRIMRAELAQPVVVQAATTTTKTSKAV